MMRFLGTGAAETLPNPFCDCPVCTEIRRNGRPYHKKRSCFQVSDQIMIDFGPDVIEAAHEYNVDFCSLRHILFTHSHDDHLSFQNLSLIGMSEKRFAAPIELYFSAEALRWVCKTVRSFNPDYRFTENPDGSASLTFSNGNAYHLRALSCAQWYSIGDCEVKAVRSSHPSWGPNEWAWNYLIRLQDGRKLLYACDTGRYPSDTIELLSGEAVDILIMECTFGSRKMGPDCGHLDVYSFLDMLHTFEKRRIIHKDTKIYSTHLNHKHTFTPLMLQEYFDRNATHRIHVARDGDVIL